MDLEFRFHAAEQERWQDVRDLRRAKEARHGNASTKLRAGAFPRLGRSPSGEAARSAPRQPA
jgi:hypothetical protein